MDPSNLELVLAKDSRLLVAAFYAFTPLDDGRREALLTRLPSLAREGSVLGSVLVAHEGVNGTISGPEHGVDALLDHLRASLNLGDDHYARLEVKRNWAEQPVFRRFKARRKKEIVTIGMASVDPSASVGTYVEPEHWNALVDEPDTLVIDTRNSYETAIGTFDGAIDPDTQSFREFPQWADTTLRPLMEQQGSKRIAMFCTGGIRCEKASSYLQQQGFGIVHQCIPVFGFHVGAHAGAGVRAAHAEGHDLYFAPGFEAAEHRFVGPASLHLEPCVVVVAQI